MKLLIISGKNQPVPPVNGGAVENLIQMFYKENEKYNCFDIIVVSCKENKIDRQMLNYRNTSFYFLDRIQECKFWTCCNLIFYKIFKIDWIHRSKYADKIVSAIITNRIEFDLILIENNVECVVPIYRAFKGKKIFLHLHNDKINSSIIGSKYVAKCCENIICVSDYINKRVNTIANVSNKTSTIINSICVEKFGTDLINLNRNILRRQYGVKEYEILVLFSGRITKAKGILELIKAFKFIKNKDIKLMIVGSSWYGEKNLMDRYSMLLEKESKVIKEKVIFTGYIDYDDMPNYYGMADIVVIPSIWQEPCGLTLLEAMASKVPLITTRTGGIPEVVKNYARILEVDNRFVENLALSIEELAGNKSLRKKMADAAYEYVQYFNPERYYRELSKILVGD